ncbi:MAG: T9SS type A sorting domain-containing protein [Chitinophagales bacterium]
MIRFINMKELLRYVGVTICTACAFLILNISTVDAQILVVPSDVTIECGGSSDPALLGVATATDGCGATIDAVDISFADNNTGLTLCGGTTGVIVRSWTASATAACGGDLTGSQSITIEDTTPPVINCPADVYLGVNPITSGGIPDNIPDAADAIANGEVSAVDGCSTTTIIFVSDEVSLVNCVTTITRTYEAMDDCGNTAQCTQMFTFINDMDNDGICDEEDSCPMVMGQIGDPCSSGTPCVVNETIQDDCTCGGGTAGNIGGTAPLTGSENTYEGEGGIAPFGYNINYFDVYGGNLPYTFIWDKNGYVRTTVYYTTFDLDDDGIFETQGATVTIVYTDESDWSVTVQDIEGCDNTGGTQLVYTNVGMGTQLDIIASTITPDDGTDNGAIDITVIGGEASCMPYAYEWYYQDGTFAGNTEDISGLAAGWYTVIVTCADDADETVGWFYVEPERRGRGKLSENVQFIKAYPNPFSTETTIEFSSSVTENVNVEVYSLDGKLVADLYNGLVEADQMHQVQFSAKDKPAGVYIVQYSADSGSVKREKLVVVK